MRKKLRMMQGKKKQRVQPKQIKVLGADEGTKERPARFEGTLSEWLAKVSGWSTLHGLAWYSRVEQKALKALVFTSCLVVITTLSVVLFVQFANFLQTETVRSSVEWKTASNFSYPTITVCHPKFFSLSRMKKYNVSTDLANYLILTLDVSAGSFQEFMSVFYPDHKKKLIRVQEEFEDKLASLNLTGPLELFHLIAKKCGEFITFCEDHRTYFVNEPQNTLLSQKLPECCGEIFDSRPFFTYRGICFSTKKKIVEVSASLFSAIIIWLGQSTYDSPDMQMSWQGSAGSDREGALWSVSDSDHPAAAITAHPNKVIPNSYVNVGLSVQKFDRTKINKPCSVSQNETFESVFGMKNTIENCRYAAIHFVHENCSLGLYSGLKPLSQIPRECTPQEVLSLGTFNVANISLNSHEVGYDIRQCVDDCMRTHYETDAVTGQLGMDTLARYFNATGMGEFNDTALSSMALHFFFSSFEYSVNTLDEEGIIEFLSKIGGWMSLALGASVFSVIETILFVCYLFQVIINKAMNVN